LFHGFLGRGRWGRPDKALFLRAFYADGKPKFYHTHPLLSNPGNARDRCGENATLPPELLRKSRLCVVKGKALCV
jgi:hypothetical protein